MDAWFLVMTAIGVFFGSILGTAHGVKDERKKAAKLINAAMRDAYKAGYADGKSKKRNLGDF